MMSSKSIHFNHNVNQNSSNYLNQEIKTRSHSLSMAKASSETDKCRRKTPSLRSPKHYLLLLLLLTISAALFHMIHTTTTSPDRFFMHQWRQAFTTTTSPPPNCTQKLASATAKLREAVTFLPLKDLRYAGKPLDGHTWFMSSTLDAHENGGVQFQEYPSAKSKGRILCLKGGDAHDGSWNSYAFAWPQTLPPNATFAAGLTFISYNHYDYDNIWHGLSAAVPFVAWHLRNKCAAPPLRRWILYHRGELRVRMGTWLSSLMAAAFGEGSNVVGGGGNETSPACFERAVVMRHNEGGMSRERRLQVYDFLRCRARVFCNVSVRGGSSSEGIPVIGMTVLMRIGPRSFTNQTAVVGIFSKACREVAGCRLTVAYANNLTFCQQVKLMSATDVLVSPHGAQLTNMFMMDRNSSVMEFFPKGWLRLAGVGQFVFHWIASWSGMNHRGAWRDTAAAGDLCSFPDADDRRCMSVYKNARIGYNETYFYEWASNVLSDFKLRKAQQLSAGINPAVSSSCPHCGGLS